MLYNQDSGLASGRGLEAIVEGYAPLNLSMFLGAIH